MSCTPPSGSSFGIGTTEVRCTATDAQQRTASCRFTVTVAAPAPPRLNATNFVAFGDSITEGVLEPACPLITAAMPFPQILDVELLRAGVSVPESYPSVLQDMLASRYPAQSPIVTNEGRAGERATDGGTLPRLRDALSRANPQVLLLLEGVNEVNGNNASVIAPVVAALRVMVREAQARRITVMVGTLLPERAGACRGYAPSLIAPSNDQIRAMVVAEGAVLVDLYEVFAGREGTLLGNDGLHPNAAGYQQMAQTFLEAIRARFESTPSGSASRSW